MILKPQDILVVLKLLAQNGRRGTFAALGRELGMSASETNAAFHRARNAGLINPLTDLPVPTAVAELLIHGLKYLLPVQPGRRTRGSPTGYAAPPLAESFGDSKDDPNLPVWPDPHGIVAGLEIRPIFRSALHAAKRDPLLYEWLVLADAMRGAGRARERERAEAIIRKRLGYHANR
jgi:hypothetical protein